MEAARRRLAALLIAFSLLVSSGFLGADIGSAGTSDQVYMGAWVGDRVNIPGDLDGFEVAVGKKMAILHRYSGNPPYLNGEHFNVEWANWVRGRGSIPMVSWEPRLDAGNGLALAAAGSRDDYIRLWARELRDWGHPIFFRMMWEQNAIWFPWSATTEPALTQFKTLWRRIVAIFREEGVNNVTFVWSPNVSGFGAAPIMDSYPGDDCVDWVALDGYPYKSGRGDFYETFKPDYDLLVNRVNKPLMIAETSLDVSGDLDKSARITDILTNQLPNSFPKVKALVWFDEIDCDGINYSIMTDWGPLSQQAFRRALASDYYVSNVFSDLSTSPIPAPDQLLHPAATPTPTSTTTPTLTPTADRPPGQDGNLVANAGFETPGSGTLPANWSITTHAEAVSLDSSLVHAGARSLKHSSTTGPSYSLFQEIQVTGGLSYGFVGWVRVSGVTGYPNFSLQLIPMNANGGMLRTITLATFTAATNGWQEVRVTGISMPGDAVKARLAMKVDNLKGTVHADDFVLLPSTMPLPTPFGTPPPATQTPTATIQMTATRTATATAVPSATPIPDPLAALNLLANPSFSGTAPGTDDPAGWTISSWANPAYVSVDPIASHDAVGAGLLVAGENSSYAVAQEIPARGGGHYSLSGWVNVPSRPSGSFKVEVVPIGSGGGTVGSTTSKSYFVATSGWEPFNLDVTLPAQAMVARVQLRAENFRRAAHVDDLLFLNTDPAPTATSTAAMAPTATWTATAVATMTAVPTATPAATMTPTMSPTPTLAPPPWGNLLVNPSFRGPLSDGWVVPGWVSSLVLVDPAAAVDGDGRGLMLMSEGNQYAVSQEVAAAGGDRYELTGRVNVADMRGGALRVEIVGLNSNNGVLGTAVSKVYRQLGSGWEGLSLTLQAPGDATKVRVQLKSESLKGRVYLDGMGLVPGNLPPTLTPTATSTPVPTATAMPTHTPTVTATSVPGASPTSTRTPTLASTPTVTPTRDPLAANNLLANPSFSAAVPGTDDPADWVCSLGSSYVSLDPSAGHDGVGMGLKQVAENNSYQSYQDLSIQAGGQYVLTGWVNVPDRRGGALKVEIIPMNSYGGTVGTVTSKGYYLATSGWETLRLEASMPSNATKARVQLRIDNFRGMAYTDDLSFFAVDGSSPATATPTWTLTPVSTVTPTATAPAPTPTAVPPTATSTAAMAPTATWTATAVATMTAVPTATPAATMTPTMSPTPTLAPPPWGNLLVNPSFRGPLSDGWVVPGWVSSLVLVDPAAAVDGDGRGLMLMSEGNQYTVSQEVAAAGGDRYELTGRVNVADMRGGALRVEIVGLNSNNGVVGTAVSKVYRELGSGWEGLSLTLQAPTTVSKVRVQLKSESLKGRVYLDGMGLVPGNLPPTLTPTATSTPVPTATPVPTDTPLPTVTPTNTPVPTVTPTATYTATLAPTWTITPTSTIEATYTPTPVATATMMGTPTIVPTATVTPQPSPTPSPTNTPLPTSTMTPTPTRVALSGNLIDNGSFTRLASGTDDPDGWYIQSWGLTYVSVSSTAAQDGDGKGLLQSSEGVSYLMYQDVPVTPGQRYLLRAWVNVPDRRAGSYKLEMLAQTALGGSAGYLPAIPGYFSPTSGWQAIEQEFVAPSNAARFRLQLRVDGLRGSVYTDALSLVAVQ